MPNGNTTSSGAVEESVAPLDALLMVLERCVADDYTYPWPVLHSSGGNDVLF